MGERRPQRRSKMGGQVRQLALGASLDHIGLLMDVPGRLERGNPTGCQAQTTSCGQDQSESPEWRRAANCVASADVGCIFSHHPWVTHFCPSGSNEKPARPRFSSPDPVDGNRAWPRPTTFLGAISGLFRRAASRLRTRLLPRKRTSCQVDG